MEVLVAILGVVALIIVALLYGSLSWGFVVSKFYVWFVLPLYPDAPQFTLMQFVGLMFFLSALLPKVYVGKVKKEYREDNNDALMLLLAPWISFVLGWAIHLFY